MSKLYKVSHFSNNISMVGSKIIFIYLYKGWSYIKIEANYLHTAYPYFFLETFIPIVNDA